MNCHNRRENAPLPLTKGLLGVRKQAWGEEVIYSRGNCCWWGEMTRYVAADADYPVT